MAYPFPSDVAAMVREAMRSGRYASEDDLLRDALRSLDEEVHSLADDEEADLAAVREAIAEFEAGDPGIPLDEAFESIRQSRRPLAEP